ncbi:MAG: type III secretion system chaperone [Candidatus Poribacteria bacterium]
MSKLNTKESIVKFLKQEGYEVTEKEDGNVLVITDEDGFTIFSAITDKQIEFVVDICGEKDLKEDKMAEIYRILLDLNTEIQPTCYGINNLESEDPRIVLIDSLPLENLDVNELQISLSSLAQNTISAVELLTPYLKSK